MADLRSTVAGTSAITGSCTAGQTLTWNSGTDNLQCQSISVAAASQITGVLPIANGGTGSVSTSQAFVFAGPASGTGAPSFRALASTDLPAGTVTGTGTTNYVPYFSAASTLSNSPISVSGSNVGIGSVSPGSALDVKGTLRLSGATSGYVGLAPAAVAGSTTYTLPSADGAPGFVLRTDGAGILSWISNTAGSVTSVTAGTGLTGGTITGTGTIGLDTELAGLNGLSTTGLVKRTGAGTYSAGAVSLTADVSGVLPLANGGTNANLTAVNGGVAYSSATAMALSAAGSAGQILRSAGAGAPVWSTATYPATAGTAGQLLRSNGTNLVTSSATFPDTAAQYDLLYASGTNAWSSLAKANSGALVTSSTG
ncbi:MAG: hypothetical protein EOP50_19170, partial [Sphingobacteriales bacterium]